ncbi:TPA: hypothetical protein N0F65_004184 [Lagenidium giganteum]|uniref:Uncharacterized protein n=1 Tax=Lagenidium giganteum TaxID=4803 RepID=A0AAV2YMI9_9STRA|nr:TPA: hypothetical protein N0F65_004184 [Lagenidium giganteum]
MEHPQVTPRVDKPRPQLKIFLSLTERGHSVRLDVENVSTGMDWETGIKDALQWVKDAQGAGRVLHFITPRAQRRPDGSCIHELAVAASMRLRIFPVLIAFVEPLGSIAQLPFFDMRDCVPSDPKDLDLPADSAAWRALMQTRLDSPLVEDKFDRLCSILERFETVSADGVAAVGGFQNMCVFDVRGTYADDGVKLRRWKSPVIATLKDEDFSHELPALQKHGLEGFFHGDIPREAAQGLLMTDGNVGSYVIRYSRGQASYAVAYVGDLDEDTGVPVIKHNLIFRLPNGKLSLVAPERVTNQTDVYPDLASVVQEYLSLEVFKLGVQRQGDISGECGATKPNDVYRSKVCVVGPSKWGKTSFIKTFTSNQATLEEEDQRTIGIDLFTWKFDTTTNHADEEYTVTLWDFAGQDEYQSAHTLFFSRRTLYVLCVNLQAYAQALEQSETTDDPDAAMDEFVEMHLYHWVRVICAHFPESKFVFVGTKLDLIGFDTDKVRAITGDLLARIATKEQDVLDAIERDIEALNEEAAVASKHRSGTVLNATSERMDKLKAMKTSRPQFLSKHIHTVSSADRHGMDDLRRQLEQYVVRSETGFAMPATYAKLHAYLRDRVALTTLETIDIKEVVSNTFVSVAALLAQLQQQEAFATISAVELTAMMHVFHDLGDILWFDSDSTNSLAQTVFLSPVVVIDFIRQVINHTLGDPKHARTKVEKELYAIVRDEGRVANSLVRKLDLWKDMSNDTMAQLKELLYQFQLAYPAGKSGMKWDSDLIWEYVFRVYLPENLFEKLGVQSYSAHYSCDRQFNHDGFETTMDDVYHTRVVKRPVDVEGSVLMALSVEVYAVQRDAMWEQLIWHALNVEKLLENFPGLWVSRYVVTNRGKRLELNKLVEQEQEQRATADIAAHAAPVTGSGLLPPHMEWYIGRQWRQPPSPLQISETSSQGLSPMEAIVAQVAARIDKAQQDLSDQIKDDLTHAKADLVSRMDANKDALMTMSAGDDNRRLYPALWTLEYQTSATMKTTTLILKIRSDLSGKCYHEPLEITHKCAICADSEVVETHFSTPRRESKHKHLLQRSGSTALLSTVTYERTSQLKIFLSYGHDRFQQLAFHLKHALQERGHSVWVDIEKLSAGIDWEDGINSALTWVKDAQHEGRVVLLMTPHALRRPDGYCLNEIARAASNRLNIFPVLVADTTPPPSITMLPFFDMRDCVPTDPDELKLDAKSDEWNVLMRKHLHSPLFEDKCERLFAILELFDTMSAYGVPAVGGFQNMGVFALEQGARESRGLSVRRLMTQASSDSVLSIDTPLARQVSNKSLPPATPTGARGDRATSIMSDMSIAEVDDSFDDDEYLRVRYMFSFDSKCYPLAKKLYDDMSECGFSVFPPAVPPSSDSETSVADSLAAHEEALQWAAAEKNGKMVLLVTPESVGRPSGVCLNDISAAMAAGIGFVPLMVRQCEIPLSICRIQWLDMSDALIYQPDQASTSINEVRYQARKDQLITALKGKLDHEGQQARLFSLLAPFSFQAQISKLTHRFCGRSWLFETLKSWIESPSGSQVFWVTGQMGSGKTAAAARMVQTIPEIAAFHFALQEDEQTQNARRCVLSLAYQLTTQLPEYAVFLHSGEPLEEVVPVSTVQALITHLVVEPLNAIARPQTNKPLVLLLDGLEHLASSNDALAGPPPMRPTLGGGAPSPGMNDSEDCLVAALPSLISRLPTWVRVVVLSREDPGIVSKLQNYSPTVSLDKFEKENREDIRSFVEQSLCPPSPSQSAQSKRRRSVMNAPGGLSRRGSTLSQEPPVSVPTISLEQAQFIADRSEGLFLYAVNIVQTIEEGRLSVDQLESLPVGMGGYLRQFFVSHFEETTYKTKIRPVLEVLCAAYEPLPIASLGAILDWSQYEQHDVATSFGSLFYITDDGFLRPFHSSVLDWVQDIKNAGTYYADVLKGHEQIGKWAAREYGTVIRAEHNEFVNLNYELEGAEDARTKTHIYIVRHACNHLMQAQGEECMKLVGKLASDEKFQLARRLLGLREKGLESFFHGDITRERSQELLLTNARAGSFLIRYSARQKSYCASFIEKIDAATGAPKIKHNLIYHLKNGAYSVVPPEEVTNSTVVYPDLISFVEQYQRKGILKAAIPRQNALNREISTM